MEKIIIFIKWFLLIVFLGVFGRITSPLFYPLWDLTGWRIFWIWGNDSRLYSDGRIKEDYEVFLNHHGSDVETFWLKFRWHVLRNTTWNLRDWLTEFQKGDGNGRTDIEVIKSDMTLNGSVVVDSESVPMSCGLKYKVKEGQNPWQGWTGDEIDLRYSILGENYIWFKQDGIKSFRYSYCKKVKYWGFWERWKTIKITCIKSKTTLSLKYQK